jgi:hypothetical protein
MGLLLFVALLLVTTCSFGKLYHVIPEDALHDALGRLCEASMDIREGIADGSLPEEHPLCVSVPTQRGDDIQRAFAEYRDVLQLYGFKVSYETMREYLQRKLINPAAPNAKELALEIYRGDFCMDIHKLRQIHAALQCKRHDKQHHQGARNKRINEFL